MAFVLDDHLTLKPLFCHVGRFILRGKNLNYQTVAMEPCKLSFLEYLSLYSYPILPSVFYLTFFFCLI